MSIIDIRDGKAELIPNELGKYKTSSAVSVLPDGTVLIGAAARERLILNPNLHLTEAEQELAMERIREIQLAAQGSQREQLLLERALRLYEQTTGRRREWAGRIIAYWKGLMEQGDLISRERAYGQVQAELEVELAADPFEENFWNEDTEESDE